MASGDKPAFVIRARQEPDSEYMTTVGSAWKFRNGEGYVLRIHSMPVKWDGSFILVPPLNGDAEIEETKETPRRSRRTQEPR